MKEHFCFFVLKHCKHVTTLGPVFLVFVFFGAFKQKVRVRVCDEGVNELVRPVTTWSMVMMMIHIFIEQ